MRFCKSANPTFPSCDGLAFASEKSGVPGLQKPIAPMKKTSPSTVVYEPEFMAGLKLIFEENICFNRVLPPTEANSYAQQQARKLAAKPLSSLIETKRLLKGAQISEVLERMQQEGASFRRMLTEPAAKEAFGAFLQKRKPDFSKL